MHDLDAVEAALGRLMPPALRQDFQADLDEMIDELAAGSPARPHSWSSRWLVTGGIAAAVAGLCAIFSVFQPSALVAVLPRELPLGVVLVSQSGRIESMTDEGWQEDADGYAMHAVRLNVIEENEVRDEETGMLVQISQPREELLLSPISAF